MPTTLQLEDQRRDTLWEKWRTMFDTSQNVYTENLRYNAATFSNVLGHLSNEKAKVKNLQTRYAEYMLGVTGSISPDAQSVAFKNEVDKDKMKDKFEKDGIGTPKLSASIRVDSGLGIGISDDGDPIQNLSPYTYTRTYDGKILNVEKAVDQPNKMDVAKAERNKTVLGQILGYVKQGFDIQSRTSALITDFSLGRIGVMSFFAGLDEANQATMSYIPDFNYKPGFTRIQEPRLKRYSLDQILNQNTLKPRDSASDQDTFEMLYTRSSTISSKFKQGTVSSVQVKDLREPNEDPKSDDDYVHNFVEDSKRLNTEVQDRGFIANIDTTKDFATPAVVHSRVEAKDKDNESSTLAEKQHFPFLFETENRGSPEINQYCFFQAAISNINETYTPNWSQKPFFGRVEDVYTYISTSRVVDISFVIYTTSARELQNVYERINWLAQQTYPSYQYSELGSSRIKAGPLVRFTLGDQWRRLPGIIRSLSYDWNVLGPGGRWEMSTGLRMIQACSVALNFQVIHEDPPDRNYDFYRGLRSGIDQNGRSLIRTRGFNKEVAEGTRNERYVDLLARDGVMTESARIRDDRVRASVEQNLLTGK